MSKFAPIGGTPPYLDEVVWIRSGTAGTSRVRPAWAETAEHWMWIGAAHHHYLWRSWPQTARIVVARPAEDHECWLCRVQGCFGVAPYSHPSCVRPDFRATPLVTPILGSDPPSLKRSRCLCREGLVASLQAMADRNVALDREVCAAPKGGFASSGRCSPQPFALLPGVARASPCPFRRGCLQGASAT